MVRLQRKGAREWRSFYAYAVYPGIQDTKRNNLLRHAFRHALLAKSGLAPNLMHHRKTVWCLWKWGITQKTKAVKPLENHLWRKVLFNCSKNCERKKWLAKGCVLVDSETNIGWVLEIPWIAERLGVLNIYGMNRWTWGLLKIQTLDGPQTSTIQVKDPAKMVTVEENVLVVSIPILVFGIQYDIKDKYRHYIVWTSSYLTTTPASHPTIAIRCWNVLIRSWTLHSMWKPNMQGIDLRERVELE